MEYGMGMSDDEVGNKQISLTQYYSHFVVSTCDEISQCISCETEPSTTLEHFSKKKNIIAPQAMKNCRKDISHSQTKPKIWKCLYKCGKIFTQERYMKNHILVMHENTSSIRCKVCSRYLSTKARLKSHMLRHAGVQHLVCLVCLKERANDLSCIRHHLLEEHGIGSKHSLFQESYYEMSLKEMSLMKRSKRGNLFVKEFTQRNNPGNKWRKSATHVDELKLKLLEKSRRVRILLNSIVIPVDSESKPEKEPREEIVRFVDAPIHSTRKSKLQKIVTAENGMKLVKLSSGEYKKFN